MKNEVADGAINIVGGDLKVKSKQLRRGSVNTTTALNTATLGLLNGSCSTCFALQVLDRKTIGCAARIDQIRRMATARMEGDLSTECELKTDIPAGATIVKNRDRITFSGSETFFRNLAGK